MIIKSVEVKNFRSIQETCLDCDNLTAIIGQNGAGKSSFLEAIDTFYDIAAPITKEDFFDRDMDSTTKIRVPVISSMVKKNNFRDIQIYRKWAKCAKKWSRDVSKTNQNAKGITMGPNFDNGVVANAMFEGLMEKK